MYYNTLSSAAVHHTAVQSSNCAAVVIPWNGKLIGAGEIESFRGGSWLYIMETVKNLRQANVVETHERKFNFDFLEKYLLEFNEIYNELKGKGTLSTWLGTDSQDWTCIRTSQMINN